MSKGIEWAGGLFEGEGSITVVRSKQKNGKGLKEYLGFRLTLSMADEDVVREFYRISGEIGTIYLMDRAKAVTERGCKPMWCWQVQGQPAMDYAWKLMPYLGERRRTRFTEITTQIREAKQNGWRTGEL